jgi:hypothetical protein
MAFIPGSMMMVRCGFAWRMDQFVPFTLPMFF